MVDVNDEIAFFMAGPRFSYRTSSRFTRYFELLFGAAERSVSRESFCIASPLINRTSQRRLA